MKNVCFLSRMARPGLGDLLQRNIFLDLLKQSYPGARLTWVLGDHVRSGSLGHDMVRSHSYADDVIFCPDVDDDPMDESGHRRPGGGWPQFIDQLTRQRFDVAVTDPRSVRLGPEDARTAGIGIRIALPMGGPQDRAITHPMVLAGPGDLHDYAAALAGATGLRTVPEPEHLVPALPLSGAQPPAWATRRPLVGIHPTCSPGWHRRWPLDRFTEIGRRAAASGATVVVLGGRDDVLEAELLVRGVTGTVPGAEIRTWLGRPFEETAAVIAALDVLVGNDSGPAHLAAALRTPSVVMYGPDGEAVMWQRSYPEHTGLDKHFACQQRTNDDWEGDSQCSLGCPCEYSSPDGAYPRCLAAIGVDEVWDVVSRRITR